MHKTNPHARVCKPGSRGRWRDDVHLGLRGEFQGLEIGYRLDSGPNQFVVGKRNVARDLTCQASIKCIVARSES